MNFAFLILTCYFTRGNARCYYNDVLKRTYVIMHQ